MSLLPQDLVDKLPETYVNPEAAQRGEDGNFLFFDLRAGERKWSVPPNKRIRVSRQRLTRLLLQGIDVQVVCSFPSLMHYRLKLLYAVVQAFSVDQKRR